MAMVVLFVCIQTHVHTMFIPGTLRGKNRASNLLKLELSMVNSTMWALGTEPRPTTTKQEQQALLSTETTLLAQAFS